MVVVPVAVVVVAVVVVLVAVVVVVVVDVTVVVVVVVVTPHVSHSTGQYCRTTHPCCGTSHMSRPFPKHQFGGSR